LFHPDYRASFRFGAVTLRPGMTTADVVAMLKLVLRDAAGTGTMTGAVTGTGDKTGR
jgi:hypothetical protein